MSNLVMCETCNGSGIGSSGQPETDCYDCGGSGGVELRDEKGRFKKFELAPSSSQTAHSNTTTLKADDSKGK